MAYVIEGGTDVFNAMIYGDPHPGTRNFLRNQVETISDRLTDAGRNFMQGAREVYERVSGSVAARMARAASRQFQSLWQQDTIRELTELAELQTAPLTMQRWIMAEPTIRKLYQKQSCDGYADSYLDVWSGDIGEEHYDWRRVHNGLVQFEETEAGEESDQWYATTYMEDLLPDDEDLYLEDQVDIKTTWSNVVSAIRSGKDPTSKWDSDL